MEQGEKHILFFTPRKIHYCNKLITKFQVGDNVISSALEILEEGKKFYQELYNDNNQNNEHINAIIDDFTMETRGETDYKKDKPPKIAYDVLTQRIQNGGMKLIEFQSKVKGLKSSFVKRLLDESNEKWKAAAAYFLKTNNLKFFSNTNQTKTDSIYHKFYANFHIFWTDLQQIDKPTSPVVWNQVIWENKYITIANKPFCWQNWLHNGIICVRDLLGENGDF